MAVWPLLEENPWVEIGSADGLQCVVQHNWRHSLANAMRVTGCGKPLAANGSQSSRACGEYVRPVACCHLPLGKFSFAASGTSGMQPLVGLEKLLVGDQSQIVVWASSLSSCSWLSGWLAANLALAHSRQNLDPESPLALHTCLWAAPSHSMLRQVSGGEGHR